LGLGEGGGWV